MDSKQVKITVLKESRKLNMARIPVFTNDISQTQDHLQAQAFCTIIALPLVRELPT